VRRPQTPSTPTSLAGLGGLLGSGTGHDPIDGPAGPTNTHSGSADKGAKVHLDSSVVEDLTAGAVQGLGEWLHTWLARTEAEKEAGVWLASASDEKNIGEPLARLAKRNAGPIAPNRDMADLITAGVGLAAYGLKNARKAWSIRRAAKKAQAALPELPDNPGGDEQAAA
jgi:hypothetical protein